MLYLAIKIWVQLLKLRIYILSKGIFNVSLVSKLTAITTKIFHVRLIL